MIPTLASHSAVRDARWLTEFFTHQHPLVTVSCQPKISHKWRFWHVGGRLYLLPGSRLFLFQCVCPHPMIGLLEMNGPQVKLADLVRGFSATVWSTASESSQSLSCFLCAFFVSPQLLQLFHVLTFFPRPPPMLADGSHFNLYALYIARGINKAGVCLVVLLLWMLTGPPFHPALQPCSAASVS